MCFTTDSPNLRVFLAVFAMCCFSVTLNFGQEYQPGQKVEVEFGTNWAPGVIVEKRLGNVYLVETEFMQKMRTIPFPTSRIRAIKAEAPKESKPKSPDGSPFRITSKPDPTAFRTWKDANGKFEVKAKLIEYDRKTGKVTLQVESGKLLNVPFEKFSGADRKLISEAKDNGATDDANPFTVTEPASSETGLDPFTKSGPASRSTRANSNSKRAKVPFNDTVVTLDPGNMKFRVGTVPTIPSMGHHTFAIQGANTNSFRDQIRGFAGAEQGFGGRDGVGGDGFRPGPPPGFNVPGVPAGLSDAFNSGDNQVISSFGSSSASTAALLLGSKMQELAGSIINKSGVGSFLPEEFKSKGIVYSLNLKSQRAVSSKIEGSPLAVAPQSDLVAYLDLGSSESMGGRLVVQEMGSQNVLCEFPTKSFMDNEGFAPEMGAFLNDSLLVTVGKRIVVFDVYKKVGYSTSELPAKFEDVLSKIVVSPNQKHIALIYWEKIIIFDAGRGVLSGEFDFKNRIEDACFSPDGAKLACVFLHDSSVKILDLESGLEEGTFAADRGITQKISWPDERFILVHDGFLGRKTLFDLKTLLPVWRYNAEQNETAKLWPAGGKNYLFVYDNNATTLQIPHADLGAKLDSFNWENATILGEGEDVRFEFNLRGMSNADAKTIEEAFTSEFKKRGIEVSPNSKNVFRAFVEQHQQESRLVAKRGAKKNWLGKRQGEVKVKFTPTTCHMELVVDGDVRWSRKNYNYPAGTLMINPGESPQSAATRICKPKRGFFTNPKFPAKFVDYPSGSDVFGISTLSHAGIRDQ